MGGAGHMLHAIKSLKQNRDLLKSRRSKNRVGNNATGTAVKIEFKEVSPEELQIIKETIRARAMRSKRKNLVLGVSLFSILTIVILWMVYS